MTWSLQQSGNLQMEPADGNSTRNFFWHTCNLRLNRRHLFIIVKLVVSVSVGGYLYRLACYMHGFFGFWQKTTWVLSDVYILKTTNLILCPWPVRKLSRNKGASENATEVERGSQRVLPSVITHQVPLQTHTHTHTHIKRSWITSSTQVLMLESVNKKNRIKFLLK